MKTPSRETGPVDVATDSPSFSRTKGWQVGAVMDGGAVGESVGDALGGVLGGVVGEEVGA